MPLNETASRGLGTVERVLNLFDNIVAATSWIINQLNSLGLTNTQTYAIITILALVAVLLSIKFFEVVSKILIVGLIIFVIVSLLGIV